MSTVQSTALEQTVQAFGYANSMVFAREQAMSLLQQRMAYYQSRIDYFTAKYGCNYETFCQQFHTLTTPTLFERENDSMEWETALDAFFEYQHDFSTLV
jgi:hypothetical protein